MSSDRSDTEIYLDCPECSRAETVGLVPGVFISADISAEVDEIRCSCGYEGPPSDSNE